MLITKEVEVGLKSQTIKWYEDKGYEIPRTIDKQGRNSVKKGTKIIVKVEDLTEGSGVEVDVMCDGENCGKILTIRWGVYNKHIHQDGKYYCIKCTSKLFGIKKAIITRIKNRKSFYQWCYDNLPEENANKILAQWDCLLNVDEDGKVLTPKDVTFASNGLKGKGYWFKCLEHPEHGSEQKNINSFTGKDSKVINCHQCNLISTLYPQLVKYFVNKSDAEKYSIGSKVKVLMKCPDCGYEKEMPVYRLLSSGLCCNRCSDGISYPEKFVSSILGQLLTKYFQIQLSKTTLKWCEKYKYDNYIDKINCIIEVHGIQHYDKTRYWKMSLEETQENDRIKKQLAKENGINNYIIIDCRYSELEWIKK